MVALNFCGACSACWVGLIVVSWRHAHFLQSTSYALNQLCTQHHHMKALSEQSGRPSILHHGLQCDAASTVRDRKVELNKTT
jgi:hypothetical protein